jgi:hypothetical protein
MTKTTGRFLLVQTLCLGLPFGLPYAATTNVSRERTYVAWHCITLPGNGGTQTAATSLIEQLEAAYAEAERPDGAEVFHRRRGDGSHEFFLSPLASKIAKMVLLRTAAVECAEPTGPDRLLRVRL